MVATHCKNGHEFTHTVFNKTKGVHQQRCRTCHNAYMRNRSKKERLDDPEKVKQRHRNTQMKTKYGITWKNREAILEEQSGKCANPGCGKTEAGGQWNEWCVDHDHSTGKVRGLLCPNCNTALGLVGENIDRLLGLVSYLKDKKCQLPLPVSDC